MNVCGLISWYDEQPDWLYDAVTSFQRVGASTVVAVDGAYALYPGGTPRSDREQRDAVLTAADDGGMACTIHQPRSTWPGGEVEKRAYLFAAGEANTGPDDWYFILDGDEQILSAAPDLHERLGSAPQDAAYVALLEDPFGNVAFAQWGDDMPTVMYGRKVWPLRCVFRAIRGLTVKGRHHDYVTPDGRNLWGDNNRADSAPAITLPDVVVDHRPDRPAARLEARAGYYRDRDAAGIERKLTPTLQ